MTPVIAALSPPIIPVKSLVKPSGSQGSGPCDTSVVSDFEAYPWLISARTCSLRFCPKTSQCLEMVVWHGKRKLDPQQLAKHILQPTSLGPVRRHAVDRKTLCHGAGSACQTMILLLKGPYWLPKTCPKQRVEETEGWTKKKQKAPRYCGWRTMHVGKGRAYTMFRPRVYPPHVTTRDVSNRLRFESQPQTADGGWTMSAGKGRAYIWTMLRPCLYTVRAAPARASSVHLQALTSPSSSSKSFLPRPCFFWRWAAMLLVLPAR